MKPIKSLLVLAALAAFVLAATGCDSIETIERLEKLQTENGKLADANRRQKNRIAQLQEQLRIAQTQSETELYNLRAKLGKLTGLELLQTPEGLVIRMTHKIAFPLGKAKLTPETKTILAKIGGVLREDFSGHYFRVVGHTDKVPIKPARRAAIPDNWVLACLRASTVVRYLVANNFVEPGRIMPAGMSFYDPIVGWGGKKNVAENRRVEIFVLPKMAHGAGSPPPDDPAPKRGPLDITPK